MKIVSIPFEWNFLLQCCDFGATNLPTQKKNMNHEINSRGLIYYLIKISPFGSSQIRVGINYFFLKLFASDFIQFADKSTAHSR